MNYYRPEKFPDFALLDEFDSINGQPNVKEPSDKIKESGWNRKQDIYKQYLNWIHRTNNDWIKWLDSLIDPVINYPEFTTIINQAVRTIDSPTFNGIYITGDIIPIMIGSSDKISLHSIGSIDKYISNFYVNVVDINNTLDSHGIAHFYNNIIVDGLLDANNGADIEGNVDMNGTLDSHGIAHFYSNIIIDGLLDANNGADIEGNVDINGTLDSHGIAHFYSNIIVDGLLDANNGADIEGNVDINGTLDSHGIAHFYNNAIIDGLLDANNGADIEGNVDIEGNIDINGTLTINQIALLKNDNGILRIRNKDDNDDADLIVKNLIVNGTTTTINSEIVTIADNIILLNSDVIGIPSQNAGIEIERGDQINASLIWDEGSDSWKAGLKGSELQILFLGYQGVWNTNGNNIYYNTGNIGIGTSNPASKLEVRSGISSECFLASSDNPGLVGIGYSDIVAGRGSTITDNNTFLAFGRTASINGSGYIQTFISNGNFNNGNLLLNPNGGNIGIGTTSPTDKLEVNGNINVVGDMYGLKLLNNNKTLSATISFSSIVNSIVITKGIAPNLTNSYDLGSLSYMWRNGYFSGTLDSHGIAHFYSNVTIDGLLDANNGADIEGNVDINGTLDSYGIAHFYNNVIVDGSLDITIGNIVNINTLSFSNLSNYVIQLEGSNNIGIYYDISTHIWSWKQNNIEKANINLGNGNFQINGGLVVGSPTGNNKGIGTINAVGVYDDNVLLTGYVLDKYVSKDFDISNWDKKGRDGIHKGAREFLDIVDMCYNIDKYNVFMFTEKCLPAFYSIEKNEIVGSTGEMISRLWQDLEIAHIHIYQLNEENKKLKERILLIEEKLN
ncbi:MAG: hypothetical protein WC088_06200 [Candidatus Izemoplasmatales bacterium]